MRQDARALLDKLSQQDFKYKQFEDPYSDMHMWPIFEALLKDERIASPAQSAVEKRQAELAAQLRQAAELRQQPETDKVASFFDTYSTEKRPPRIASETSDASDLRSFLAGLGR